MFLVTYWLRIMVMDFPGGSDVKASAYNEGNLVQSLGCEDLLEKTMATHSGILAWKIPWTEEPVGYSPWGHRVRHNWLHFTSMAVYSVRHLMMSLMYSLLWFCVDQMIILCIKNYKLYARLSLFLVICLLIPLFFVIFTCHVCFYICNILLCHWIFFI